MRFLKGLVRSAAFLSMAVFVTTEELTAAVFLLAFGSMSLGILIGEKSNEEVR